MELVEGECWAADNEARIIEVERWFLAESRKAHEIAEQDLRQARRIRRLAVAATIVGTLAVVGRGLAALQWLRAEEQVEVASERTAEAVLQRLNARKQELEVGKAKDDAVRQKGIAVQESARARTEELRAQTARLDAQRAAARVRVEQA